MHKLPKIAIIGSGNIGGALAYLLGAKHQVNMVLLDHIKDKAVGRALDIMQGLSLLGSHSLVYGTDNYIDIKEADLVVVTAGIARKPGMSRADLVATNAAVIKSVAENISLHSPQAFIIVVTNPLDSMAWLFQRYSKINTSHVVGMAGALDTARFRYFLAQALEVSVHDIATTIIGEHGDSMIPLLSHTSVAGIPILSLVANGWISEDTLQNIVQRARGAGAEIVQLLQTTSAYLGPAAAILKMCEAYLYGQKQIISCSVYMGGKYGIADIYLGAPTLIGPKGVERIVELALSNEEKLMLQASAQRIRQLNAVVISSI